MAILAQKLSFRPISPNSHRIFLIFLIETQFWVLKKMAKKISSRKIPISLFWPKNCHFGPKMVTSANFSKSSHRMLLIFLIKLSFGSLKKWPNNFPPKIISISTFWPKNGPKIVIFGPKMSISANFSKYVHKILLIFFHTN